VQGDGWRERERESQSQRTSREPAVSLHAYIHPLRASGNTVIPNAVPKSQKRIHTRTLSALKISHVKKHAFSDALQQCVAIPSSLYPLHLIRRKFMKIAPQYCPCRNRTDKGCGMRLMSRSHNNWLQGPQNLLHFI
jgi:hypothetical protein